MATVAGTKPHPIYLAGQWVESSDPLEVANPAKPDEPAGATFNATPEQYDQAVTAAQRAFDVTRKLPAYERGRILRDISAGIKARREELGRLIALEAGKPIRDALVEADRAALTFRLGAEEAERMHGELIPLDLLPSSKDRVGITRRFPIGPIGKRRVIPIRSFDEGRRSSGISSPVIRSASSAPRRNVSTARSTSTRESRIGLPASRAMSRPSSSRRARIPALISWRIRLRS